MLGPPIVSIAMLAAALVLGILYQTTLVWEGKALTRWYVDKSRPLMLYINELWTLALLLQKAVPLEQQSIKRVIKNIREVAVVGRSIPICGGFLSDWNTNDNVTTIVAGG